MSNKERYIKQRNLTSDELYKTANAFQLAEAMEQRFNKDLCEFNIDEVKTLLNYTNDEFNNIYYDYCNWCLEEALIQYINPYELFVEDDEEELD